MSRILLADDHQILRDGMRRSLEAAGETVVGEASNGEQAVEMAIATTPNAIIKRVNCGLLRKNRRRVRMAKTTNTCVVIDSINQPVWNKASDAWKIFNITKKVNKSKREVSGPR